MDSRQRIEAAIALEPVDRVPVSPWLGLFAASYTGISKQEFIFDADKRSAAVLRTAVELGPWDMTYMGENASEAMLLAVPARVYWPGVDLPDDEIYQVEEFELLSPDDYALLQRIGLLRFLREVARRLHPEISVIQGLSLLLSFVLKSRSQARALRAAGVEPAAGGQGRRRHMVSSYDPYGYPLGRDSGSQTCVRGAGARVTRLHLAGAF